ncbi:mannan polymerase complex subunit mnn9 [Drechslerella stenobrocha 248]|uniref:Mannan polymerase complex subunit mnn9 n=1 Tax=Drechslerella stenobrocha 248 TaxID=1043628 RepID=W7HM51_9PEZI|nr:mannan polymerase complex subunit mnn9 [Drechslerella stenobrocha 248]
MGASRSLQRSSPMRLLIALIGLLLFLWWMIQPPSTSSSSSALNINLPDISSATPTAALHPPKKAPPILHITMNNLSATAHPLRNQERLLILTPLARFYDEYWQNLLKLDYPRHLIELGFIVPKTHGGNTAIAGLQEALRRVQNGSKKHRFSKVTILRQDFDTPIGQTERERHALKAQKDRRAAMARARNSLLFTTLDPGIAWVLWLDSDIVESPPSLFQDLAMHNKPVIVPNCFQRYRENGAWKERPYDFNSWQDSETAQNLGRTMKEDDILLEGYAELPTYRALMAYQRDEKGDKHTEMLLDGVGGTALLVKAEIHRDGAMFPTFPFYHLIETEGFAKMVRRLGHQPYGLPNYLVYHYNE